MPVLRIYDCHFEDLLAGNKAERESTSIEQKTQLALKDPPYNLLDFLHDTISAQKMVKTSRVNRRLVRPGAHVVIIPSDAQTAR